MTTPPHIEAIARAIKKTRGVPDDHMEWHVEDKTMDWRAALAAATLAFHMSAEVFQKAMADEIADQGFSSGELWIAERIERRFRALASEEG